MLVVEYLVVGTLGAFVGALVMGVISGVTRYRQINYAYMEGFADGMLEEETKHSNKEDEVESNSESL